MLDGPPPPPPLPPPFGGKYEFTGGSERTRVRAMTNTANPICMHKVLTFVYVVQVEIVVASSLTR